MCRLAEEYRKGRVPRIAREVALRESELFRRGRATKECAPHVLGHDRPGQVLADEAVEAFRRTRVVDARRNECRLLVPE
jgi:hypothetical protein